MLQDVELNELRSTINSLRQQNYTNMTLNNGRSQSPVSSSSSGSIKSGRHRHHQQQQQQHHRSADSIKSDSFGTRREAHVADASSGDHSTKKHKSWVRLSFCLFLSPSAELIRYFLATYEAHSLGIKPRYSSVALVLPISIVVSGVV